MLGLACVGEPEPRARPKPSGRTGLAGSAAALWSRMNDAKSDNARTQRNKPHYNYSSYYVKHQDYDLRFHFPDFLGSIEGSIWRVARVPTLLVVSPSPSASSA